MDKNTKDILNRPFDRAQIKERKGPNGRVLSYVAIGDYIARLNEAFSDWSYEITDTRLLEAEAIVQVRLSACGMIKMGMGGAPITRRRDSNKPVSLAHDLMAAEASALKRACRLLGIGAALYLDDDEDDVEIPPVDQRPTAPAPTRYQGETPSSPRITNAQLGKLRALVAESGGDWTAYRDAVRDQHGINVEYANRQLASELIQELLADAPGARPNRARNSNGHGHNNGQGHSDGWRRP